VPIAQSLLTCRSRRIRGHSRILCGPTDHLLLPRIDRYHGSNAPPDHPALLVCGICGIIYADPHRDVEQSVLAEMTKRLTHRGPDDEGYLLDGPLGLGMRRLSIIDVVGGGQPIHNEDGSVHTVYNGEIYNYRELKSTLESA